MGTDLVRYHGGHRGRLPAGEIRPSPSVKPGRSANPARHTRTSPRQADDASPGAARSPPLQTKALRKGDGSHATPGRSGGRRGRIPEPEGQLVVKMPVKRLVMEEVTILKRGEEVRLSPPAGDPRPNRPAGDPRPNRPAEDPRPNRPAEDPRPSDQEGAAAAAEEAGGVDVALCSTDRLGPDPEILPKQMRLVEQKRPLYAGSGFFTSPSPRSLPLPTSFFAKKEVANRTDLATRGLRYLLRLDLP